MSDLDQPLAPLTPDSRRSRRSNRSISPRMSQRGLRRQPKPRKCISRKPQVAWLRSLPCSYFCDSCEFLWQALFVQSLFVSQPYSGHKEAQNSQEDH